MPSTSPAIEFDSVTRSFGSITALSDLNIEVHQGELYGFLGPNGAGKTTAIGLVMNFLKPTNGTIRVFGQDTQKDELAVKNGRGRSPRASHHTRNSLGTNTSSSSVRFVESKPSPSISSSASDYLTLPTRRRATTRRG